VVVATSEPDDTRPVRVDEIEVRVAFVAGCASLEENAAVPTRIRSLDRTADERRAEHYRNQSCRSADHAARSSRSDGQTLSGRC
jgi:hypothetical protein